MGKISVLDCTLRDGGYVNNWEFGEKVKTKICQNLVKSGIDYIEAGFLGENTDPNKTIYSDISKFENIYPNQNFCFMINWGKYNLEKLPQNNFKNIFLRLAFKKNEIEGALKTAQELKNKGYNIFINPMVTDNYSEDELIDLIKKINIINPHAITIADTLGDMTEDNIIKIFNTIDKNLDKNIALCFHSHNNTQHSFANTQTLINLCKTRDLIIDSSVFGMGRGVGNLCTEQITQYLNKIELRYDISYILNTAKEYIMPIYEKKPWGCDPQYYLTALNHCHPNYAKFLKENTDFSAEKINGILQSIPEDKKPVFDRDVIENLVNNRT